MMSEVDGPHKRTMISVMIRSDYLVYRKTLIIAMAIMGSDVYA